MADDVKLDVTATQPVEGTETDYIATIQQLKETTVPKAKFEKAIADNKKLLDALVNGGEGAPSVAKPITRDNDSIKRDRQRDNISNLEFIKDALELRANLLNSGKPDPFLPIGEKIVPDDHDIECANRTAKVFQECVDYAQGDSDVFTNELRRRTIDTGLPRHR